MTPTTPSATPAPIPMNPPTLRMFVSLFTGTGRSDIETSDVAFGLMTNCASASEKPGTLTTSLCGPGASGNVALPAVIVAYSLRPDFVPVAMAAVGGGHFLPYAWLQRTPVYAVLGVVVSLGAFALQVLLQAAAFPWILLFMALCYAVSAPMVYRNARLLTGSARGGL